MDFLSEILHFYFFMKKNHAKEAIQKALMGLKHLRSG